MLFSRKKEKMEAAAAENAAVFSRIIEDTQKKAAEIQKIADAGARYMALVDIEEVIHEHMSRVSQQADEQVQELLVKPRKRAAKLKGAGVFGTGAVLAGVGMIALTGGVGFAVYCVGCALLPVSSLIGVLGLENSVNNPGNPLTLSKDGFCAAMKATLEGTARQKEDILKDELAALLASSHIAALCDRVPEVQKAFTRAAIRDGIFSPPAHLDKAQPPKPKK